MSTCNIFLLSTDKLLSFFKLDLWKLRNGIKIALMSRVSAFRGHNFNQISRKDFFSLLHTQHSSFIGDYSILILVTKSLSDSR